MKNAFQKFNRFASGYGGMLFIAVLGLSVLIFGGILTNVRQARELRGTIVSLELAREQQTQIKPILAAIAAHQRNLLPENPPAATRPLETGKIASLAPSLAVLAAASQIELVSVRHLLQPNLSDSLAIRVEIRLDGELQAFRRFLENLLSWEHPVAVEGFNLQPDAHGPDFQLVVKLPVT